jgi:hypothetical protein
MPSLTLLMEQILENLLLANIKGSYMIFKINQILAHLGNYAEKSNGPIQKIIIPNYNI